MVIGQVAGASHMACGVLPDDSILHQMDELDFIIVTSVGGVPDGAQKKAAFCGWGHAVRLLACPTFPYAGCFG
jgi:hypothetical protein